MESESESDKSDSDSELSTAKKTFTFDSEQLDSDDEMKIFFEWNYVYHDNIKHFEGALNANEYLKHVSSCTGLHIIKKNVSKALKKGLIALFHLFIRKLLFSNCRCKRTNRNLDDKGNPETSTEEIIRIVGIEIGISYSFMNNIRDYWKTNIYG